MAPYKTNRENIKGSRCVLATAGKIFSVSKVNAHHFKSGTSSENRSDTKPGVTKRIKSHYLGCKQNFSAYVCTRTVALVVCWFAMGMSHRITPATLPDIRARVGITVEEVGRSTAFTGVGGMIGAVLGSVSDRYTDKCDLILSIMIVVASLPLALRPYCTHWLSFAIGCFFEGIGWACVNTVGNPMLVSMWGKYSGAPMQALHFGYPLGSMVGPLLAYPFVSKTKPTDTNLTSVNSTNITVISNNTSNEKPGGQIEIPYIVIACFSLLMAGVFLIFQCVSKPNLRRENTKNRLLSSNWRQVFSPSRWGGGSFRFGTVMAVFVALFYFLQTATVRGSVLYYTSYAVESHLAFSNQEGTLYSSAINLAGALGRATGLILAIFVPVHILLPLIISSQALTAVCTAIWGLQSKMGFIASCAIFSFTSLPVWPCGYSWIDRYIYLSAVIVGLGDLSSKLAGVVFGYLLSYLYDYTVKESIFYNTAVSAVTVLLLCIIMSIVAIKHGNKYETSEDQIKRKTSSEDLEDSDDNKNNGVEEI